MFEAVTPLLFTFLDPVGQAFKREAACTRSAPLRRVLFRLMPLRFNRAALLIHRIAQTLHEATIAAQGADRHGAVLVAAGVVGEIAADLLQAFLVRAEQLEPFGEAPRGLCFGVLGEFLQDLHPVASGHVSRLPLDISCAGGWLRSADRRGAAGRRVAPRVAGSVENVVELLRRQGWRRASFRR